MYAISYHHTEPSYVATSAQALEAVRDEAMRVCESAAARQDIVTERLDGAMYCWLDEGARESDDTGEGAFAIISRMDRD